MSGAVRHAFTVDVEVLVRGHSAGPRVQGAGRTPLDTAMNALLGAMDAHGVKGTFFWLGTAARAHPGWVRRLHEEGHEIGCHGWSHDPIYTMTHARFAEETRRATDTLTEITGDRVELYRAAYFSITRRSLWALETLVELGYRCDSSVFPVRNWRYGIADFEPRPQTIQTPSGPILEVPMSVRGWGRWRVPVSGGAYFRLFPFSLTRSALSHGAPGRPVNFYLHPWELDPNHPKVRFHWRAWATHYANLDATLPRLPKS